MKRGGGAGPFGKLNLRFFKAGTEASRVRKTLKIIPAIFFFVQQSLWPVGSGPCLFRQCKPAGTLASYHTEGFYQSAIAAHTPSPPAASTPLPALRGFTFRSSWTILSTTEAVGMVTRSQGFPDHRSVAHQGCTAFPDTWPVVLPLACACCHWSGGP